MYTVYTDGGAKPNPGLCGSGVVIYKDNTILFEGSYAWGKGTNNVAEWNAIVKAIEKLNELGIQRACIYSDSQLVLKQISGEYKIKNQRLLSIYTHFKSLHQRLNLNITFLKVAAHSGVEGNEKADSLATLARSTQKTNEFIYILKPALDE